MIAKAWQDANFYAEVMADPRSAIANHFGYELSPNLNLKIEEAPDANFEPADLSPDTDNDPWSSLPKLQLTIVIPPAPDPALQAVAITAYQDTGRTYPFTCC